MPNDKAPTLAEWLGVKVIFGIRPERIHDRQFAPPRLREAHVTATVNVVEAMGSETYIYLVLDRTAFVARVDPRTSATSCHKLEVVLNMDCLHLLDSKTGTRCSTWRRCLAHTCCSQ